MASRTDEVLLRLKFQADGVQQLVTATEHLTALQKKSLEMQRQQAATSTANAAAMGKLAGSMKGVETAAQSLDHNLKNTMNSLGALGAGIGTLVATATAGAGALGLFSQTIAAGADMERWKAAFGVLLGGADEAEKHLAKLAQFAATTPFELPQIIEASKLLESLSLDTDTYLKTLGNVSSFLDKDLTSAVLAVGNARRGEFENLKTFGVDISMIMKRAGIDITSTTKRTSEDNQKIVTELMKFWDEKFGGGMDAIAKTTTGKLSNISDAWFQFKVRMAQSGIGDVVSEQLSRILAKIEELEKNGTLEKWAKTASGAMEFAFNAVVNLTNALTKLKEPIIFLVGATGMIALTNLVQAAAGAYTTYAAGATVASAATGALGLSITALGGPLVVALGLLGGIALWAASQAEQHKFDEMNESVARLNAELETMKLPTEKESKAAFAGAVIELKEAQARADRLAQWIREMEAKGADVRILAGADKELDGLLVKIKQLKDEQSGLAGRDAPIALPAGAIADVRAQTREAFGVRAGEAFGDFKTRLQTGAAAKKEEAPPVGPTDKEIDEAKKRFAEAVKIADGYVKLNLDMAAKLADNAERQVDAILAAEGQGATARLALLERFEKDAFERTVLLANARADAELEIDRKRTAATQAALTSGASAAVTAAVIAEIEKKSTAERRALAESIANGNFELAFATRIAASHAALLREREASERATRARERDSRVATARAVAEFEMEYTRTSALVILATWTARRDAVEKGSKDWLMWNERVEAATKLNTDAQKELNEELQKFLSLGIDAARAAALLKKGITPEDVAAAGAAVGSTGPAAANAAEAFAAQAALDDLTEYTAMKLEESRALWTVYFEEIGFGWQAAATMARGMFDALAAGGTAAYGVLKKATTDWFKHHAGTHALGAKIVAAAAREGGAAFIDAVADMMQAEAAQEAAAALRSVAKALEFPWAAGTYLAAAAKHGAAAIAFGGGAAVVSGAAEALRTGGDEDENAAMVADPGSAAATNRSGDTRALRSVSGNAPITQNFNLSIQFLGTNVWMPGAAEELVQGIKPALQAAFNNREFSFPAPGGK